MKYYKQPMLNQALYRQKYRKGQSGAALIIALLIVFIVASLSVTVSSDFLVMIRRVENQTHGNQAYAYLVGAEGLGRWFVLDDKDLVSDHLGEVFLSKPIAFANEIAQFNSGLEDLQGRLNVNNLLSAANGSAVNFTPDQQRFVRLLQTLELEQPLDQSTAEEITNAVIDWLDADSNERQPGGAENLYYGDAIPAGRAANRAMISVSELRWVKGVTAELYDAIRPHLTVWGNGRININTASENVLRSLNKDKALTPLDVADIAVIIEGQQPAVGGYKDISFFDDPPLAALDIDVSELDVKSEAFLLTTKVLLLERQYELKSVIKREAVKATVIARTRSDF